VTYLAEQAQQVSNEKNHYNGAQAYSSAAAGSPTPVAVVSSTASKKQQQNYDEDEHFVFPV
jgi:hypothetical protein